MSGLSRLRGGVRAALAADSPLRRVLPDDAGERVRQARRHLPVRAARVLDRQLGWRPHEFWGATPTELASCLTNPAAANVAPLDRSDLQRLMESDPDGHG